MYSRCPACTADLGSNEVLEVFPVGTRLAFDLARGRLWVLCPACRAWNLAPLSERWEAVEEAERLFETARIGATTERMAIGRVADGTELVRVGGADRRELAGWRYARRLESRARRAQRAGWIGGGAAFALMTIPVASSLAFPTIVVWGLGSWGVQWVRRSRTRLEVPREGYDPLVLRVGDLRGLRLIPSDGDDEGEDLDPTGAGWRLELHRYGYPRLVVPPEVQGRAIRIAMADANRELGKPKQVGKALDRVLELGDATRVITEAARTLHAGRAWENHMGGAFSPRHQLRTADPVLRLALEIAANEDAETRALDGELHLLENEWKEAEELAAISDDLLLSAGLLAKLREMKRTVGRGSDTDPGADP